jgi:hypothetical protein
MAVQTDEIQILPSAARSAAPAFPDFLNTPTIYDGIEVALDLTAFTTAASLTINIQEWVPSKQAYVTVLSSPVIAANGTTFLRMFPMAAEVANLSRSAFLPKKWRVTVTHGNGNSHTYSLDVQLIRFFE